MRTLAAILLTISSVASAQIPTFATQEIDASLKIGYGVILVDISGDGKPDIVVADKERVIWFENPTWKLRVITEGKTAPDNVCIDAHDIDGDGQLDLALGAGWKPGNTKEPSTLQWLRRGKTLAEPWTIFPIAYDEPTLHRMRFIGSELITVPLMGRGATKQNNWMDAGVRIQRHVPPNDPTKPAWQSTVLNESLHVAHNFTFFDHDYYIASYEGVTLLGDLDRTWKTISVASGDQTDPAGSRGASEIKVGKRKGGYIIATVEPWHGYQVVVYTSAPGANDWKRSIIDDQLRWGHAIWCADLDGDGGDEIIVGVRDPLPGQAQSGVRVYRATGDAASKWEKSELDPGGVAVEDLAVADLNGDGKPDIVAVGRQTKNVRIYWNQRVAEAGVTR